VTEKVSVEPSDSFITCQKDVNLRRPMVKALEAGSDQTPQGFGRGTGRTPLPVKLNAVHSVRSSD
jgi:hypothetical protein